MGKPVTKKPGAAKSVMQPTMPIRIDPTLKAWLAEYAKDSGTTLNGLLKTAALKEALAAGADPGVLDLPETKANEQILEIISDHQNRKGGKTAA